MISFIIGILGKVVKYELLIYPITFFYRIVRIVTGMLLQNYNYFYQTALIGNMTKAAESLYISQPALSKAISNLENLLGCQLFIRNPKGVTLTIEGEILFRGVKEIFSLMSETQNKISDIKKNRIFEVRIGVGRDIFSSYLLPRMKNFYALHPTARFRIDMLSSQLIIEALLDNRLDIGIMTQSLESDQIFSKKLFPITDCFITGEKYKNLTETGSHSIYELINYFPIITLPKSSLTRKHMDSYLLDYGLVINPIHEVQDTNLIAKMVSANFGIGLVTENFVRNEIENKDVYKIPLIEKLPYRDVTLSWSKNLPLSSYIQDLLAYFE